jgi:MFS family permease
VSEISLARSRVGLGGLHAAPDFWRLCFVGLVVFVVRWLETIAIAVFVYQRTGSPFSVAMMVMLRLLPMGLFGAFLGAAAERFERRSALIFVVLLMGGTSQILALLAHFDRLEIWHLALASFINGVGWATDNPVRRVMIGEVVGTDRLSMAMSIDVGTNNASRMLGPTAGGLLLANFGIGGAFTASVCLYVFAAITAFSLRYRNATRPADAGAIFKRIAEGLAVVRRDGRLVGTLVVTVIYNLFGWPFTSMVPVIGHDQLQLDTAGVGILASLDGVGAFCGSLFVAFLVGPALYGRVYVGGMAAYLAMLPVFALVADARIAGGALLMTGLGGAAFSIMQATLVYTSAPPEMRSRMLGVLSVCIGTGPIGFVGLGLMADAVGAPTATAASGAAGLLALMATWKLWRVLLR